MQKIAGIQMKCPICDNDLIKGTYAYSCRTKTTYHKYKVNHFNYYKSDGIKVAFIGGNKITFDDASRWSHPGDNYEPPSLEIEGATEYDFEKAIKRAKRLEAFK